MLHPVKYGKTERMSYSRIPEVLDPPNLIDVQKTAFEWFIDEGLKEVLEDISPIEDYTGDLVMEFIQHRIGHDKKYTIEEAKDHDANYSAPLYVTVRLFNRTSGEIKEQEVFMGDMPVMTPTGTFIINGSERVIVNQLVRSPGVYYKLERDRTGKKLFSSTLIPNRGAWIEFDRDSRDVLHTRIDRNRKIPMTVLVRALGVETNTEILDMFGESEALLNTLEKDTTSSNEEALIEIYKKLRPGEPPTLDSAQSLFNNMFFDHKRYDLSNVGRYKFNEKLSIASRIEGFRASDNIVNEETGELLASKDQLITEELAYQIELSGINEVKIFNDNHVEVNVIGNNFVPVEAFDDYIDLREFGFKEKVYYPFMKQLLEENENEDLEIAIEENFRDLLPKHILADDILASVSYQINLMDDVGFVDDIDHLGNRRVRSIGELLQNQYRIGFSRMERAIREKMTIQDMESNTPQSLINIRPFTAAVKEFFGSSQLSQFMDQTNPLAELTHKRRMSALGPGGLSRERAGFEVRDVHNTHYGRMCPIETPEGPNIGLITSLTSYARLNEYGFIETPYRRVVDGRVTDEIRYLTANEDDKAIIAQSNEPLDENGHFINERVVGRGIDGEVDVYAVDSVEYMDVSPKQIVSVGTAMIPFLENDDANRALMGANMQRQAVPLLVTDSPIVGTGMEYKAAKDSGVVIICENSGTVSKISSETIEVTRDEDSRVDVYDLIKFRRSNDGTTINQRPIVKYQDRVEKGDILADGPSTDLGEMALGRNIRVAFMNWEGYNFEDAILISEDLVIDDTLTSIHIEEYEAESRETKLGSEEITRDIPNVGPDMLKDLDERGIIRIGAEVAAGDILVGKVTPKGETELSPEERLLRSIFGEKAREVRDSSLRVPNGENGIVIDIRTFTREGGDELSPGVNEMIRVYVATKRKISVGDKLAGRHGNKGVVSRILPREDMPYTPDGKPIEMILNPLGVPSRMNLGQVLEVHLSLAAKELGWKVATPVFDGASDKDIEDALEEAGFERDGQIRLRDGRSGEDYDSDVTVGYMYMLKLHHLVDEKLHARSTGPYSLVTQQPLGGKAQFGGQRLGEMEVWALEAYGAAHTLQEMLTIKSDDIVGRVKAYEAIVKGENVPEPGVPESFKVLIKELQSLALSVDVKNQFGEEINLDDDLDDDLHDIDSSNNKYEQEDLEPSPEQKEDMISAITRVDADEIDEDLTEVLD